MADKTFEEVCQSAPEQIMFHLINNFGSFIFHMNHDMALGRIPEKDCLAVMADVQQARKDSNLAVSHLSRFNLIPLEENGTTPTSDYWAWFRWWDSYFKSLSNEEFNAFDVACTAEASLDEWRPAGDWRQS